MQKLNLKISLLLLLSLSVSSCNLLHLKVAVHDAEWCADLGNEGATCVHTLNDETRDITKLEWDIERVGMLCTTADSFSDMKKSLEQLCYTTKLCTYKEKIVVQQLLERLNLLDNFAIAK